MAREVRYFGIICSNCPVLIVIQKDDAAERERMAEMFTKQYGREHKPEDINCDGCTKDSACIFKFCNVCQMRKCARKRNIDPTYRRQKLSVGRLSLFQSCKHNISKVFMFSDYTKT